MRRTCVDLFKGREESRKSVNRGIFWEGLIIYDHVLLSSNASMFKMTDRLKLTREVTMSLLGTKLSSKSPQPAAGGDGKRTPNISSVPLSFIVLE